MLYNLLNAIPGALGATLLVGLLVKNTPAYANDPFVPVFALCVAAVLGAGATALLNPRKV